MLVFKGKTEELKKIGQEVQKGKIVAFPTDTVYGLGASIEHIDSVKRVFEVKDRPLDSAIIILIDDISSMERLAFVENPKIYDLAKEFWPGALTLVLPKKDIVDPVISAGGPSVGIRIPDNDIARELIKYSGGALATPSANKNGQLSPTRAEHVMSQFSDGEIDYLVDGGKTKKSIESTILDMTCYPPKILRNGGVSKEDIEKIIGEVDELSEKKKSVKTFQKELKFIKSDEFSKLPKEAILLCLKETENFGIKKIEFLSKEGNLEEAVENLYDVLHKLIKEDTNIIYVEELEEKGLGKLIMERIKKIVK